MTEAGWHRQENIMQTNGMRVADLKRASETRDAHTLSSFYADNAVLRIIDCDNPPSKPRELKGRGAIIAYYDDVFNSRASSFRSRDPGALHNLCPAHDLRFDEGLHVRDRWRVHRDEVELDELILHLGRSKDAFQLAVQLLDNRCRRSGRRSQHEPAGHGKTGNPGLGNRRDVGKGGNASAGGGAGRDG